MQYILLYNYSDSSLSTVSIKAGYPYKKWKGKRKIDKIILIECCI